MDLSQASFEDGKDAPKLKFAETFMAEKMGKVAKQSDASLGIKVRDLTRYHKYKNEHGQIMSLKNLTAKFCNRSIQQGQHSSVIDARASMALYRINEEDWESTMKQKNHVEQRKRAEHDVKNMRNHSSKMSSFFGNNPEVKREKKRAKF
jgi:RNA exonuclease 4